MALTLQPNLARRIETQVAAAQVEDLLNAGAGVEHQSEKCVIAPTARSGPVDAFEQGVDLTAFQVLDRCIASTTPKRNREKPL